MQVSLNISNKSLIQLIFVVHPFILFLKGISTLINKLSELFSFVKSWDFSGCKKSIHLLQKSRTQNVTLIKYETNLFLGNTSFSHYFSQVVIEIQNVIFTTCLYLKYL